MKDAGSSRATKLNSDHRDVDPSHGGGLDGFVIMHQSPVAHQPTEGSLYAPVARQYVEALGGVEAFDDLNGQFGAESFDPLGEGLTGVTAIHPQDAQLGEPAQNPPQKHLGAVAFGGVGRSDGHTQHQSQSIHQQMALAAFNPLVGVIAHAPAVPIGLDALTVQDGGRWPAAFAVCSPHENAQGIINHGPLMVGYPLTEYVINGFPVGKVGGQITPWTSDWR